MTNGNTERKQMTEFEKGQVIGMHKMGFSTRDIAKEMGRGQSTIQRICQRYDDSGETSRRQGTGTKNRKTSAREDKEILEMVKKNRFTSAPDIKKKLKLSVSERTIQRRISYGGYSNYFAVKKPFISDANRLRRLKWAREHFRWPLKKWQKVLFSDESPFVLRSAARRRVWRLPNERYAPWCVQGTVKHSKKVMVWGCFSYGGVGHLHRVKGIMRKENYHQILVHHMKPSAMELFGSHDFIFQQDNDPKHTSKLVKSYLGRQTFEVMDWPSQSPDLSPIENLWALVDSSVKDRKPQNENELFRVIAEAWNSIPLEQVQSLVNSMRSRCKAVIDADGWPTKY